MSCCIGKARVFYRTPKGFIFRYKLNGGSWIEIVANEPLNFDCVLSDYIEEVGTWYRLYESGQPLFGEAGWRLPDTGSRYTGQAKDTYERFGTTTYVRYKLFFTFLATGESYFRYWPDSVGSPEDSPNLTPPTLSVRTFEGTPADQVYDFMIFGENTEIEYANIGELDECPAVENLGCVMGEENYYDTLLPDQLPGGNVESSCFKKIPVPGTDCFHVVLETKYKNLADKTPTPPKMRSQLYLCGLPGCPAEYRIECCPEGECDPPKCPPDTDCELDCGSFVCCYKNGKVIKTIRK